MDKSALFKLSYGLYVLGVKNGGSFGGCVVDAVVQATSDEKPIVLLCCMNGNNTTALIEQNRELTLSVLPADVDPFVIANFGYQSSREVEKWNNLQHDTAHGLPVLKNAAAYLFLKCININKLSTHTVFACVVEDAWQGSGSTPLIYGEYFKGLKDKAMAAFNDFKNSGAVTQEKKEEKWVCSVCGYTYDGDVPFEDLPEDWTCPLCGQPKSVFEKQ